MRVAIKTKEVQPLMDVAQKHSMEPGVATVAAAYVALLAARAGEAFPLPELEAVLRREKKLPGHVRDFLRGQLAEHWEEYRRAAGAFDGEALVDFFGNEAIQVLQAGRCDPSVHPAIDALCLGLLDFGKGGSFADLHCGSGQFVRKAWFALWDAAGSDEGLSVTGWSQDVGLASLAFMLCDVAGVRARILEQSPFAPCTERYDRILLVPPFGMGMRAVNMPRVQAVLEERFGNFPPLKRLSADWVFAARAASLLRPGGRAVVAVPSTALNGTQGRAYREFLVRNRLVESVISLPRGFLPGTRVPFALVVLGGGAGEIKFVDGGHYAERRPGGTAALDAEALLRDHRDLHDYEAVTTKAIDKVFAQDCNLMPEFHLAGDLSYINARPLGELVEGIRRGAKLAPEAWAPAAGEGKAPVRKVSLKHFGDGMLDDDLPGLAAVPAGAEEAVAESGDLLVSRMGPPFKMAVVGPHAGRLVADENVWIVRTGGDRTLAHYLRAYLESEAGAKWLARMATGGGLQTVSAKNLAKIPVPDAEPEKVAAIAGALEAATREAREARRRLAASLAAMRRVFDTLDKDGGQ